MSKRGSFFFKNDLVGSYMASRSGRSLMLGLPTVLVLAGLIALHGWVGDVELFAMPNYEKQFNEARDAGDESVSRVAINALVQMRPNNTEYLYSLATLKLEEADPTAGHAMMRSLAKRNHNNAAIWVAQADLSQTPLTVPAVQGVVTSLLRVTRAEPQNPVAHALLADAYILLKQPDLAAPHTRIAARLDPVYWLKYARVLSGLGRREEAEKAAAAAAGSLQQLVANDPTDVSRRIQWGHALRAQGRLEESITALQRGLSIAEDTTRLREELSKTIVTAARTERAAGIVDYPRFSALLQRALTFDPKNLSIVKELSEIPQSEHKMNPQLLQQTDAMLRERMVAEPENQALSGLVAWSEFQLGNREAAIDRLRQAASQGPAKRLQLAAFLRETGDEPAARQEAGAVVMSLKQQLAEDPKTYLDLAKALSFLKRWDDSITVLDRANAQEVATTEINIARVRYRLKQFQHLEGKTGAEPRQLELMKSAIEIDPNNHLVVAGFSMLAGRDNPTAKQARNQLYQMLSQGQNAVLIHTQLGTNAIERGDYEMAVKHLDQAVKATPDDPMVCNNLAFAICSLDKPTTAELNRSLGFANDALKRLPENPNILRTRGAILMKLERFEDALHDFETSLAQDKSNPDTHRYLAAAYSALGNDELAAVHQRLVQD